MSPYRWFRLPVLAAGGLSAGVAGAQGAPKIDKKTAPYTAANSGDECCDPTAQRRQVSVTRARTSPRSSVTRM